MKLVRFFSGVGGCDLKNGFEIVIVHEHDPSIWQTDFDNHNVSLLKR